jgi:nicotinamide-nucleotide amidase
VALPNPNGTAPGWLVTRPDGRAIVALPGPPREMRPMWADGALPRLRARGLGADVAARTYRLAGIGESQVAELLGERLLRTPNPEVATYARVEAVDVRVSAVAGPDADGTMRSAEELVASAAAIVEAALGAHIWATGETSWGQAIGRRLDDLGWRLGVVEIGTGGQVATLFGDVEWLAFDESIARDAPAAAAHDDPTAAVDDDDEADGSAAGGSAADAAPGDALLAYARRARELGGAQVGMAVRTRERGGDTAVSVAVVTPHGEHRERHMAFLGGRNGRSRAALMAASALFRVLRDLPDGESR